MKFLKSKVAAAAMVMGVAVTVGIPAASAAPLFTIDPTAISGTGTIFDADTVTGNSSELLHLTATGAYATSGTLQFNGFSNSITNTNIGAGESRITVDYNLYLIFDLVTTYLGGGVTGNGSAGSIYSIDSLNFTLWADPTRNTTFSSASSAGAGTEAKVTGGAANDVLLALGSFVPGTPNSAVLTAGGGAALNAITTFGVCQGGGIADFGGTSADVSGLLPGACSSSMGADFFVAPDPFYQLAFSGFNNAGGGVTKTGDLVSINNAAATIIFNDVPEPGSLALLGMALGALSISLRRRQTKA